VRWKTPHKALRRYLKEAEALGASDVDVVDPSVLRNARNQIHQGVGALELVGLPAAADVLRSPAEMAVQRMVAKPTLVTVAAVETVERVSFACWTSCRGSSPASRLAGGAVPAVPGRAAAGRCRPRAPGRPVAGRVAVARAAGRPIGHAAHVRRRRAWCDGDPDAGADAPQRYRGRAGHAGAHE
jgi:hypothetical protein